MIGFCTKYRKLDPTIAALTVIRQMDTTGRKIRAFTTEWRAPSVDPAFDGRIRKEQFSKMLDGVECIFWTSPASQDFLSATHERGITNILYIGWEQLDGSLLRVSDYYKHIVTPTKTQGIKLRAALKTNNVAVLTYSPPLPVTKKHKNVERDKIKVFMSLYGSQLRRVDLASVVMLGDIVKRHKNAYVTIACSKGLSHLVIKQMRELGKALGPRWQVIDDSPWRDHVYEMGRSDITVWSPRFDGYGLLGLTSLHMGTPVISWNQYPFKEHLSADKNAILVPCGAEHDWRGVPFVQPDYNEFGQALSWLLEDKQALDKLRQHTHLTLDEGRDYFVRGVEALFPIAEIR